MTRESMLVYWRRVAAVFKRYGIQLRAGEKPIEPKIHELLRRWIRNLDLQEVTVYGVGAPDFSIRLSGLTIAIEAKGHAKVHHSLRGIMEQLRRYLQAAQIVLFVTHSFGMKAQVEGVLSVSDIDDRVVPITILELPRSKTELRKRLFSLPEEDS